MIRAIIYHSILGVLIMIVMLSCGDTYKESVAPQDPPINPYDTVTYHIDMGQDTLTLDPTSFPGLYNNIFSSTCNQPACHDGTFEPDFRTLVGAYNTLVFHPISKNYNPAVDGRQPLPYRVTPGEPQLSMMYKRISEHLPPNFEQMPSSGVALSQEKMDQIKSWIEGGALDIYGNSPNLADLQPFCIGAVGQYVDLFNFRADTARGGTITNPFGILRDQKLKLWFAFQDGLPDQSVTFGEFLNPGKVKFSTRLFEFDNAIELDLEKSGSPLEINSVFSQPFTDNIPHYHSVTFTPADLGMQSGEIYFMRTYVRDQDHAEDTENPKTDSPFIFITHFAFYVL